MSCALVDSDWAVVERVRAEELAVSKVITASATEITKEDLFCFMSVSPYLV
jgi:hypothetical protein